MLEILKGGMGNLLIALPIAMLVHICLGVANGSLKVGLDKDKFKLGIVKIVSLYLGILGIIVVTLLIGNDSYVTELNGILLTAILAYIVKAVVSIKNILGIE